jgi:hypothetical protein
MGEMSRRLFLSSVLLAAGSAALCAQIPNARAGLTNLAEPGPEGAVTDPEARLEAARYRELVLGDLKGAMEMYRSILAAPAAPRPVIARALFQLGLCLERTGQREAAHGPYTRVVKEFGDQAVVAQEASARLAGWEESFPAPRNLNFEQGVPGRAPPGWSVPALPNQADEWAQLRRSGCRDEAHRRESVVRGVEDEAHRRESVVRGLEKDHGCAVVLANSPVRVGNLYQSVSAAAYRGKTVRLRAWLRLEDAVDTSDRAQLWLSVDRAGGKRGSSGNMDDRPVQTDAWTEREILVPIPGDATFIEFGVMSYGRGRAWVDDVSFEVLRDPRFGH